MQFKEGNHLKKGEKLTKAQSLTSTNKKYVLCMQNTGHLVLYMVGTNWQEIWAIKFGGSENRLVLEYHGNLVLYDTNSRVLWESKTTNGEYLEVDNDGKLVLYNDNKKFVWASNGLDGK